MKWKRISEKAKQSAKHSSDICYFKCSCHCWHFLDPNFTWQYTVMRQFVCAANVRLAHAQRFAHPLAGICRQMQWVFFQQLSPKRQRSAAHLKRCPSVPQVKRFSRTQWQTRRPQAHWTGGRMTDWLTDILTSIAYIFMHACLCVWLCAVIQANSLADSHGLSAAALQQVRRSGPRRKKQQRNLLLFYAFCL